MIEEVFDPLPLERVEALAWSLVTRLLLRFLSLRCTVAVLDRMSAGRPQAHIAIPPEQTFSRAGRCLGRQIARSQYLRRRGGRSTIVIGVRGDGLTEMGRRLDAHAWLDRLDEAPGYRSLHRIER